MITTKIPTIKKVNPSYINWLMREVNREDSDIDIPLPAPEPYKKVELKFTEVSKRAFASLITQFKI